MSYTVKIKIIAICLTALMIAAAMPSCASRIGRSSANSFEWFDTVTELVGYTDSNGRFERVWGEISRLLESCHKYYDIYNTYDGITNLATVNGTVGKDTRELSVPYEIYELLSFGREAYVITGGEVNVAMGSVLSVWHRHRSDTESPSLPDPEELAMASAHTDINAYSLTESEGEYLLRINDPYLTFDVGAITKGFAAKKAVELLSSLRLEGESFMLNLGGMVCPVGEKPDGEPWVAGIEYPTVEKTDGYLAHAKMTNGCLVTSAAHLRTFKVDGVSYSHIIDSGTLFPPRDFAAVTVYCDDPALGDCLSTALFCMTEDEGRELLTSLSEVEAMWVYPDMRVSVTDRFGEIINGK